MKSIRNLLPMLLMGCATSPPPGVEPVTGFDIDRYLGTWYEIARLDHRFERGLTDVTATYSRNDDGTIRVVNRGWNPEASEWETAVGKAKFQGPPTEARLRVSFFGPFYGGYFVFALDRENYAHALVAGPTINYLWILARDPVLDEEVYKEYVARAAARQFPTDGLIRVEHGVAPE